MSDTATQTARPIQVVPQPPPTRSLVKKLAEIMGEVEGVAKNGRNSFHNYDYATEADIARAVRAGMAKRSVMLIPSVEKTDWSKLPTGKGGELRLCTLTVRFTLHDGDSGETLEYVVLGEGSDAGDKATFKALTGAEKYALLKIFLIPTGDDPERDEEAPRQVAPPANGTRTEQLKARLATKAAPPPADNEPPPPTDDDAPHDATTPASMERPVKRPAPSNSPIPKFGRGKGIRLCDQDDEQLVWYLAKAHDSVAENDAKWHKKNVQWLADVQAEVDRRSP